MGGLWSSIYAHMYVCMLAWEGYNCRGESESQRVKSYAGVGGTRGRRAVSFWSRNQKPSGDAEHSEVKRWSGAEVVVCVTADACEVHTVCVPGRVLNSSQAS